MEKATKPQTESAGCEDSDAYLAFGRHRIGYLRKVFGEQIIDTSSLSYEPKTLGRTALGRVPGRLDTVRLTSEVEGETQWPVKPVTVPVRTEGTVVLPIPETDLYRVEVLNGEGSTICFFDAPAKNLEIIQPYRFNPDRDW